jgi:hypothetical protein
VIGKHLMINNLERRITDRMGFHTSRDVYPAGFESLRFLTSIDNLEEKIWYRSSLIDTGGVGLCFEWMFPVAGTPSKPWTLLLRALNDLRRSLGVPASQASVSGLEQFGLAAPEVLDFFAKMPGHEMCLNFSRRSKAGRAQGSRDAEEVGTDGEILTSGESSNDEDWGCGGNLPGRGVEGKWIKVRQTITFRTMIKE